MRIYLPATLPMLRDTVAAGVFEPVGGTGFAVTDGLRAEYAGADDEDLEYLAMHDAALASLRLIAAGQADPVRVVLALEHGSSNRSGASPSGSRVMTERGDLDRAVVRLSGPVAWHEVVAVHLDSGEDAAVVGAAAAAVDAADLGDADAAVTVGDAEDIDLAWYGPGEIDYLLSHLDAG